MPHYQTDRDVGASGVGMGFLAMTSIDPDTPLWLEAAEQTGAWLMSVAEKSDNGTVFWPDYVDDGETSPDIYTSFDDGSVGIGDFFWRLYEQTGNEQYRDVSTAALRWTFSQAENIDTRSRHITNVRRIVIRHWLKPANAILTARCDTSGRFAPNWAAMTAIAARSPKRARSVWTEIPV